MRKFQLSYELGIRRIEQHKALTLGSAFHAACDMYESIGPETPDRAETAIVVASCMYEKVPDYIHDLTEWNEQRVICETLLAAYFMVYKDYPLKTIASELPWELPLVSPDAKYTKRGRGDHRNESKTFRLAGKIDRIVELPDGRLAVLETKTTGDSINDGAEYWDRLRLDSQISLYVHAARALGYDVSTVLYDVVKKPGMSLARATPMEKRKYKKDGTLYANLRDADETPAAFAERLMADVAERPDHYFARREIARTDADIAAAKREWWDWSTILRDNRRMNRWPKNPSACQQYGKCSYFEICSNGVDVSASVPMGFHKVSDVHQELTK